MRFPNNHQGLAILLSKQISNSSCWFFSVIVIIFHQNCHLHLPKGHWDKITRKELMTMGPPGCGPCVSLSLFVSTTCLITLGVQSTVSCLWLSNYNRLIFTSLPLFNCFFACNILSLIITLINLTVLSPITHIYNPPMRLFWLLFCG